MNDLREVVTVAPDNTQHPRLYEAVALGLGAIALAGLLVLVVLALRKQLTSEVVTAVVAITVPAVSALARMMEPRKPA